MRAGTVIRVRRMVAVRALASADPVRVAAARVRLNAMVASTSQAALALNRPEVIFSVVVVCCVELRRCLVASVVDAAVSRVRGLVVVSFSACRRGGR